MSHQVAELAESLETVPVDELHVAAVLESRGVTDALAREKYGQRDVFALATVIADRRAEWPSEVDARPPRGRWETVRQLCHGPVYALPSVVYPAVFLALGAGPMTNGLVFGTALGWVWGMGMSLAGYGLLGTGHEQAAARVQRWAGVAGLAVALAGGLLLAWAGAGGIGMAAFAVAQLGFQAASAILVCYRREILLVAAMLPACVLGVTHLVTRYADALVVPTLVAGGLSVVLALAFAWRVTLRAPTRPDPPRRPPAARLARVVLPGVAYSVVSAFFLLYSDSRYVLAPIDLAIAVTPLVLGMGALEWRSHSFDARTRELLRHTENTADFRREARRVLLGELTVCLLVLGGFAVALLLVLGGAGMLTSRGALLVDAHVVLGGVYFLGFVLCNHSGLPRLLLIVTAVTVAHVAAMVLFSGYFAPYGEVPVILASSVTLLLALLAALWSGVGRAFHHR